MRNYNMLHVFLIETEQLSWLALCSSLKYNISTLLGGPMKTFIMITLLAFSCSSFAWTSKEAPTKEYLFKYNLSGETLEIRNPAGSYEEAFEKAAQQCFNHYKGRGKVSENRGLDIIDVCANPRS